MLPREVHRAIEVGLVGDRPLRVGGRAQVGERGPLEHVPRHGREVGQEAGLARRRQQHRLGPGHHRRPVIDRVDRARHQHGRPPAAHGLRHGGGGQHVEPLLGPGERQHVPVRPQAAARQPEPPLEPAGDRGPVLGRAVHRRVAVPHVRVRRHRLRQDRRRRVLRLAERQVDGRHAGGRADAFQQRREATERELGEAVEAIGVHGRIPGETARSVSDGLTSPQVAAHQRLSFGPRGTLARGERVGGQSGRRRAPRDRVTSRELPTRRRGRVMGARSGWIAQPLASALESAAGMRQAEHTRAWPLGLRTARPLILTSRISRLRSASGNRAVAASPRSRRTRQRSHAEQRASRAAPRCGRARELRQSRALPISRGDRALHARIDLDVKVEVPAPLRIVRARAEDADDRRRAEDLPRRRLDRLDLVRRQAHR